MRNNIQNISLCCLLILSGSGGMLRAQEHAKRDTIKTVDVEEPKSDRNVMLNAASANTGPRDVNIGLPASVGGTTVIENDLPVVYFFWPEMPYKAWRMDAMTNGVKLLDLGQTAVNIGDVGFSVGTYDNLGTDKFGGSVGFNSNHFGLLNGTANISGPLTRSGLKFSVGGFVNYDPGTYKAKKNNIDRYYADQTQLYKVALTQDYKIGGHGNGSVSVFYKYAKSNSLGSNLYAPYIYHLDGSVSELPGFKIGSDNYMVSQMVTLKDANTGKLVQRDGLKDYGAESHTLDISGKNRFDNGLHFNYIVRLHSGKSGAYLNAMTGITEQTYKDPDTGKEVTGNVQGAMILASRKTPIKSMTSLMELGKKSGNHEWKIGLNEWLYNIDKFVTEGVTYNQTIEANPKSLGGEDYSKYEYHNGTENKTALILTDKWDIAKVLTLNLGARLEYQSLRGDFINNKDVKPDIPYLSNKKTDIKKDWFNKAFMVSAVYKMTRNFGLLGEASYNEQAGHLENYSAGNDPHLKKSKIPEGGFGVFYNHPLFTLVSKATYIQRDEYRSTVNFSNSTTGEIQRELASYEIQTIGWTTDVVATPFKGFNFHFLFTLQSPKYKDYAGTVHFKQNNEDVNYDFGSSYVTGVSKVLLEIDPSYQWRGLRVWASFRYFSKQYANLSNTLFFKGRWETFAGAKYAFTKNLEVNVNVVNLLNQRGAKGTISGTDLYTKEQVAKKEGAIMSGTYIRPFTVEFGVKYKF